MKSKPALFLSLSLSLVLFSQAQDAPAPAATAKPKGKAAAADSAKAAATAPAPPSLVKAPAKGRNAAPASGLDKLFQLVEVGHTAEGVRYPVMENGVRTSLVKSERMTRTDENLLELENAIIDQQSTDPIKFYLERATYNRQTDQLLSSQPTRIEGATYHIEGDNMNYDRKNSVARLDGRVRMVIYGKPEEAPAASAPAPAAKTPAPAAEKEQSPK